MLLADLDGFKVLNDSLGHAAGDELLIAIATALRAVSPHGSTLARLGGDEFAILLPNADRPYAELVGDSVIAALRHRRRMTDAHPVVTASVGIAMFNGDTADDLMAQADLAMYDAKDAGRDRVAIYDPTSGRREAIVRRQRWIELLRDPTDRLVAYAQRIVPIGADDGIDRVELLVRYREDDGTIVGPTVFLDIAEQTRLISRIDRWMLTRAVGLIRHHGAEIAVNLSVQTFLDPALPQFLDGLLGGDTPEGSLLIEVTETAALTDTDAITAVAQTLHALGCRIALDDFGSGFATFNHLGRLRIDVLKIDGQFIRHLTSDPVSELIVQAIVTLADGLGVPVIAEHVETEEVLAALRTLGVAYAQGDLLGRPVPVEDLLGAEP